jgi:hypothetical protein
MGSSALAVLGRSIPEFNLGATLPGRYKQFPYGFMTVGLYLTAPWMWQKWGHKICYGLGVAYAAVLLMHGAMVYKYAVQDLPALNQIHAERLTNFARTKDVTYIYTLANPEQCGRILQKAKELGIYNFEKEAAAVLAKP